MPAAPLRLDPSVTASSQRVGDLGFDAIRAELGVPEEFPPEVLAEAEAAARRGPSVRAAADLRDVPFLTIDPPGSMDLDQAMALERTGRGGYRLRYAIADVASFVAAGGAIDAEARRRVVTIYLPDERSPLHPPVLSEAAASLLPEEDRQALVWTFELDSSGVPTSVRVERSAMRSRARFTYEEVQRQLDAGTAEEPLQLLREVGLLREQAEIERGGVSLATPEQRVVETDGRYHLEYRAALPTEGWNAQLSLLTGMAAARLMLDHGVGVLRTLPSPDDDAVRSLQLAARALGVDWPASGAYPDFVRSLDADEPAHAALLVQAARLFRGAGYVAFGSAGPTSPGPAAEQAAPVGPVGPVDEASVVHAAVAAPYAHVTAPLRRLVDRFGNELVLAACAGVDPPAWATDALAELPELMADGRRREGSADRMALDLVEAAVLAGCIGVELEGVVTSVAKGRASVQVREPAVVTSVDADGLSAGGLSAGDEVRLLVRSTDLASRSVDVEVAPVR